VWKREGSEQCVGSEQSQQVVSGLFCKAASKATKYASKAEHEFASNAVCKTV
jgi:hypothetical protein